MCAWDMRADMSWLNDDLRKVAEFIPSLWKGDFVNEWFRWLEWVILTSVIWAIAEKTGSVLVRTVAFISACIVFIKALYTLEQLADNLLPNPSKLPQWLVHALSVVVSLIPVVLILFFAAVFVTVVP